MSEPNQDSTGPTRNGSHRFTDYLKPDEPPLNEEQIDALAEKVVEAFHSEDGELEFNIKRRWFAEQADNGWLTLQYYPDEPGRFSVDIPFLIGLYDDNKQCDVFSEIERHAAWGPMLRLNGTIKGVVVTIDVFFKCRKGLKNRRRRGKM